jgi:DNA-binding IclR family transcriptional regulator
VARASGGTVGDTIERQSSMISRVAVIFGAFDDQHPKLTLSEIAERADLPLSSTHRILDQMIQVRWLHRTGDHYQLGMSIFELGGLAAKTNRIRTAALPIMQELHAATGHVVHVAVPDGREAVYLDKVGGRFCGQVPTRVGSRQPLHSTSLGKAMLAFAGDDRINEVLAAGLERRTARTVVDPGELRAQLEATRRSSVAYDDQESIVGLGCVAAPIRGSGRAVAAVSVCGPIDEIEFDRLTGPVRRAAQAIWAEAFGAAS